MERYTIKASYTTNDVGARICPEEDPQGEWVKAEEADAEIERLKNDLEVSLKSELQALKAWRNDWDNIPENLLILINYDPANPEGEAGLIYWSKTYTFSEHWRFKIIDWNN